VLNLAAENPAGARALPPAPGAASGAIRLRQLPGDCVLEVEVTPQGEIVLRRAVVAIDCGSTVNPDTVRAQIRAA
jgi:isoquinoline 1-oxidoreductase beta subunit